MNARHDQMSAMSRLFAAGLFAGSVQTLVVALTLVCFLWFADCAASTKATATASQAIDMVPLLRATDLLVAIGLSLSTNRFVHTTAAHLRRASQRMYPGKPYHASRVLVAQLTIAAVGCWLIALRPSPAMLNDMTLATGCLDIAPVVWTGLLSIVGASLGANAHAAAEAL